MQLKNSTLLAITACIAGAALLLGYFFYQKKDAPSPAEPETASSASSSHDQSAANTVAAPAKKKNAGRQTYKPAESDSSSTLPGEAQTAPEKCADAACAERVLAFLDDPANDEAAKVAMAKTWLKPESKDETLSLLKLLRQAYEEKQNDLKDRLLQMLAGADSGESAELLISVLNGDNPQVSFRELPEDLQYQIKKAIRLNPDERLGRLLADEFSYQRTDETVLEEIQEVKRPDMVYQLALDADRHGEMEKIGEMVQSLQSYSDPRTLDVIMRLGNEQILTVDDAAKAAYDWADAHGESFNQERCEAYLSEPEASQTQRAVAAAALAASSDSAQAIAALQKAYDEEADQNLRSYYEKAIEQASGRAARRGE